MPRGDEIPESAQRYPLAWPSGWRRTPASARQRARFGKVNAYGPVGRQPLTVAQAVTRLSVELRRLDVRDELLSTNVALRLDGGPRSDQREPTDPGAAVYFRLKGQPRCLACDRWERVADNIAAVALHIEALRAIERYGIGTVDQAFAGYAQLPTGSDPWWTVLGVRETASLEEIDEAYRLLAKRLHPDAGGTDADMARVNEARMTARALKGTR